jgi:hypothetical protein
MDENNEDLLLQKQELLKSEIVSKNYDGNKFLKFCLDKKENGDDMNNWTYDELKQCVDDFIESQNPKNNSLKKNNDLNNNKDIEEEKLDEIDKYKDLINNKESENKNKEEKENESQEGYKVKIEEGELDLTYNFDNDTFNVTNEQMGILDGDVNRIYKKYKNEVELKNFKENHPKLQHNIKLSSYWKWTGE